MYKRANSYYKIGHAQFKIHSIEYNTTGNIYLRETDRWKTFHAKEPFAFYTASPGSHDIYALANVYIHAYRHFEHGRGPLRIKKQQPGGWLVKNGFTIKRSNQNDRGAWRIGNTLAIGMDILVGQVWTNVYSVLRKILNSVEYSIAQQSIIVRNISCSFFSSRFYSTHNIVFLNVIRLFCTAKKNCAYWTILSNVIAQCLYGAIFIYTYLYLYVLWIVWKFSK